MVIYRYSLMYPLQILKTISSFRSNYNRIFSVQIYNSSKDKIEIERKFWFKAADQLDQKLLQIGAKKFEKKSINDQYYDINSNFMLLNNFLLRLRIVGEKRSHWQLKYPSSNNLINQSESYYELNDKDSICEFIRNHFDIGKSYKDLESLVQFLNFKCKANISYKRQTYIFKHLKVDFDQTDFGYNLDIYENIPGKLSAYLFKNRQDVYNLLRENFIINDKYRKRLNQWVPDLKLTSDKAIINDNFYDLNAYLIYIKRFI
ncbi:thiamine-triphosphatase isoform X1 [Brachionus plicatilis]|uniref:Thiamine-triphosphatase isoform X1 n=1 Tax=Brachionus plicatilis TaxID=10195 RepID=A0A3M7S187_BRAPC|nr:thiamine-triphosphatase isoform X1 [Brachionus plicatilis]